MFDSACCGIDNYTLRGVCPPPAAAALLVLPNGMAGMTYTREVEIVKCP